MPAKSTATWLPRVMFESALIVISILVALGLDEWRENREDEENVQLALSNFASELLQNQARIEDAAPFNRGLRNVLRNRYQTDDIGSVDEFVNMVESFVPVVLQSAAWETALATGSLAKMKYDLVSALSLTYSLQNRYQLTSRSGMDELTSPQNLSDDKLSLALYNSVRYLDEITDMEEELGRNLCRGVLRHPGSENDCRGRAERSVSHGSARHYPTINRSFAGAGCRKRTVFARSAATKQSLDEFVKPLGGWFVAALLAMTLVLLKTYSPTPAGDLVVRVPETLVTMR